MRIPTPQELGFPAKFDSWRPTQEEALRLLLRSPKRVKVLSMPTGSGKSAVVVAYALMTRQPTCFVTENLGLQAQYMTDFESVGMVQLMGKRRYTCDLKPDYTCEEGQTARCPRSGSAACPLSYAESRAATSYLVTTNYDKWTSARKFGAGMEHFKAVVFDEGHESVTKLASAMQVTLSSNEIEDLLGWAFPASKDEMVDWKHWAGPVRADAEQQMLQLRSLIAGGNAKPSWVKDYNHLRNLTRRLATIATSQAQHWVVDEVKNGFQFDPVRVGRYGELMLLMRVPNVIVISATIRPKTLHMIGVGNDAMEFREFPSDFNPADCPIYYIPVMRVDKNHPNLSMLWATHDQIAGRRRDRKAIVHTISYLRRDDIKSHSRFATSMMFNERGEPSTETVEMFKDSGAGTILVSPSVGAGFDFPGKDCEWQFVCKIPFPDGRSKIVRARQEDDKEYGPYQATNKLVQIFGRGARFKGDRCENFIGDMHLDWFLPRYSHLFPKAFHAFFRKIETLPPPPPPL